MSLSRLFRRANHTPHELPVLESSTIFLSEINKKIVVAAVWSKPQILAHKKQAPEESFIVGENWLRCQPWVNISNTKHYKFDDGTIAQCGLKMKFGRRYHHSNPYFLPLSTAQYDSSVSVSIETNLQRTINERGVHYYTEKTLSILVGDIPLETVLRQHLATLAKRVNHPETGYFEKKLCLAQQNKVENFLGYYLTRRNSRILMVEPAEIEEVAKLFIEEKGSSFCMYPFD